MHLLLQLIADDTAALALPASGAWVRPMIIIILLLFLLALIIGPIVRARTPHETPMPHTGEPGIREDPPHKLSH